MSSNCRICSFPTEFGPHDCPPEARERYEKKKNAPSPESLQNTIAELEEVILRKDGVLKLLRPYELTLGKQMIDDALSWTPQSVAQRVKAREEAIKALRDLLERANHPSGDECDCWQHSAYRQVADK